MVKYSKQRLEVTVDESVEVAQELQETTGDNANYKENNKRKIQFLSQKMQAM